MSIYQDTWRCTHCSSVHISPSIKECTVYPMHTQTYLKHSQPHTEPQWAHTQRQKQRKMAGDNPKLACHSNCQLCDNISTYWSSFHPFISPETPFCHTDYSKKGEKQEEFRDEEFARTLVSKDFITHLDRLTHRLRSHVLRGTDTRSCPPCLHNHPLGTAEGSSHTHRCLMVVDHVQ